LHAGHVIFAANPASKADVDHHPSVNPDADPHLYPDTDLQSNPDSDANPNANANPDADPLAEGRFHS
jgi:hypothetical protein